MSGSSPLQQAAITHRHSRAGPEALSTAPGAVQAAVPGRCAANAMEDDFFKDLLPRAPQPAAANGGQRPPEQDDVLVSPKAPGEGSRPPPAAGPMAGAPMVRLGGARVAAIDCQNRACSPSGLAGTPTPAIMSRRGIALLDAALRPLHRPPPSATSPAASAAQGLHQGH